MREGKRILADPKFNVFDGSWDDRDFAAAGHALYGIVTQDIYAFYRTIIVGNYSVEIPEYVCDRRYDNRPELVKMRDKEQGVMSEKLFCFRENPSKVRKLFKWIVQELNRQCKKCGITGKVDTKKLSLKIKSFLTISATNNLCLWRVTTQTKDANNQPVKFPMLQEIDKIDACNFTYKESLRIAGNMAFDECDMVRRETYTLACENSTMTRKGRKKR